MTHLVRVAFGLFFVFISLSANSQSALLYEISGPGMKKPSYLFGTIHLICPDDFFLSDSVLKRMGRSQKLVLELDFDAPDLMNSMKEQIMFPEGKHLSQYLSKGKSDTLDNWLKANFQVGIAELGKMKPLGLMSMMYMKLLNCMPESYEAKLTALATEQKKEVLGLETVAEQTSFFDAIPEEEQANMLAELVQKSEAGEKEFKAMVELYKKQDSDGLLEMTRNSEFEMEGSEKNLLENRNVKWVPVMKKMALAQTCFFAVGAAHLGGEKGVVNLLKKEGWKVKAVRW